MQTESPTPALALRSLEEAWAQAVQSLRQVGPGPKSVPPEGAFTQIIEVEGVALDALVSVRVTKLRRASREALQGIVNVIVWPLETDGADEPWADTAVSFPTRHGVDWSAVATLAWAETLRALSKSEAFLSAKDQAALDAATPTAEQGGSKSRL